MGTHYIHSTDTHTSHMTFYKYNTQLNPTLFRRDQRLQIVSKTLVNHNTHISIEKQIFKIQTNIFVM